MLARHTLELLSGSRHNPEPITAFLVGSALLGERGIELK